MAYGKLVNGQLIEAPKVLNKNGKQYINPPEELYLEYGYFPMEYTEIPLLINGYHLVQSWIFMSNRLVQKWNYEANGVEDTSPLQSKINELEMMINSLKNPYSNSSQEFPLGDYMNPIHLEIGGLIAEKNKWYYTENKEKPHMAIVEGFITPQNFNDNNWFYFI